jgi:hypothetical protein
MPRQTPSDQGYPEKSGWIDSHRQPPRNGSSADPDNSQPYIGQPVTAAVPLPAAPAPPKAAPAPPPAAAPRPPLTRRSILRSVAGVGAVGAAAAIGAGAVIRFDKPAASLKPVGKPVAMAPMAPSAMAGPLVVYIADTTNGLLDVFGGTGATQVRNPDLVNELLANLKLA